MLAEMIGRVKRSPATKVFSVTSFLDLIEENLGTIRTSSKVRSADIVKSSDVIANLFLYTEFVEEGRLLENHSLAGANCLANSASDLTSLPSI